MAETATPGVLIKAVNGHINRGGEFEKRPAFVPTYALPAGTIGLAHDKGGIFVFGSGTTPANIPSGVTYQRLQHPDGTTALTRVISWDVYAGQIYAVGEFADGGRYHFYNGTLVTDMTDGRARGALTITGGGTTTASYASGSFTITGGSVQVGSQITNVSINGVSIIYGPVAFATDATTTAAAVAAAINSHTSAPDYTATSVGAVVTITQVVADGSVNGQSPAVVVGGDVTVGSIVAMSGGAAAAVAQLTSLQVNGVEVLGAPVVWSTSHANTAQLIADQINTYQSTPDYTAAVTGAKINILATVSGTGPNGYVITYTVANGLTFSAASGSVSLANGAATATNYVPGTFVKTVGSRVHAVSGQNEHFSGVSAPTGWATSVTGAGFIDMSTYAAGSEYLKAVAKYQKWLAVFGERVIQIWYFDSAPANNSQQQVLYNTGTTCPLSVTQFGDNDLFYCDESGLRSLRARDASNAAATTDIGVPVDTLISAKLRSMTNVQRESVVGLIEPRDGRFWLCMQDVIYVFSYFPGAKVSAWSSYEPGFTVEYATTFRRNVYVRSGDTIYTYGGLASEPVYDSTVAQVWLPYLDAGAPAQRKVWTSMDAACTGEWQVQQSLIPTITTVTDTGPVIYETTFSLDAVPLVGESTHLGLRFSTVGAGFAKLASVVIQFTKSAADDN